MRKRIIAGNWKMHKTVAEALQFVSELEGKIPSSEQVDAVVCAPFVHLPALVEKVKSSPLSIGSQNMHFEDEGAYTGEVSPVMLKDIGVQYVIIGHSERRQYYNETCECVHMKAKAAYEHGLTPIICVGESFEEKEDGKTKEIVSSQVIKALANLSSNDVANSVIAYEPVWAIGTGKTPTAAEANEVIRFIRSVVEDQYDQQVANNIRLQYGGSVKPENIKEFMSQSDIDGALVGGASLKPDAFLKLLEG